MSDYKKTLNLPETQFPMKANLVLREPKMLEHWEQIDAYGEMIGAGDKQERFILHDGPPYANAHIHLGTALNKILKDIIVKSRNMQGFKAEYVPGWDCHGLPIELKVEQELKEKKKELSSNQIRKLCREYAHKWIDIQREEFKRLGVFGVWDSPYLSMDPHYEAATARELGNFMENGAVMRSKKPIHWCASCHTALAEAEVEYYDRTSPSIYVRFPVSDSGLHNFSPEAEPGKTWVLIWTTTPWTLPDNQAVAVNPDFEYVLALVQGQGYILAQELLGLCSAKLGWENVQVKGRVKGAALAGMICRHPFYERDAPVILADYVTLDAGTGCVHTAPGHGREDYDSGLKNHLEILSPIDDDGCFFPTVPFFGGKNVFEANPLVMDKLRESQALLHEEKIHHSYPHCWRCKKPVFFRATTQWFIAMDKNELRRRSLEAIRGEVRWIPAWGEERIYSMIESRPDWCISRQRSWGVPITALLCQDCGEAWFDGNWARSIAERYAAHPFGCDYWFEASIEDLVPEGVRCSRCQGDRWKKETDILDVWFDSGTSFAAVLEKRKECRFPADMYLEGSDQHRGWFHSSLLIAEGTRGCPPYKAVLTHGYVVDGEGKKMSKSVGNVIAPAQVIKKFGAEILRIWVASVDYREDIKISDEILMRQVDAYRRIRNTCRYLLGNLGDFNAADALALDALDPLDRYALDVVSRAYAEVQDAYAAYEFHRVFHSLHTLCVNDLSAFYLDVLKDRLYASGRTSRQRRCAQTALWRIIQLLCAAMAPVLSFTAEEVFMHLAPDLRPGEKTIFAVLPQMLTQYFMDEPEKSSWRLLLELRSFVTAGIEPERKAGRIGHSLDTQVFLYLGETLAQRLEQIGTDLRAVLLVSQLCILPFGDAPANALRHPDLAEVAVLVAKAEGEKCARCWIYSTELGKSSDFPELCPRCTQVLADEEEGS